jgi:hypothetical protein
LMALVWPETMRSSGPGTPAWRILSWTPRRQHSSDAPWKSTSSTDRDSPVRTMVQLRLVGADRHLAPGVIAEDFPRGLLGDYFLMMLKGGSWLTP